MTIQEVAEKLNGRQYGNEILKEECDQLKKLGYVVVFGYSDDNAEFRGAIDDEASCYESRKIYINEQGLFGECDYGCELEEKEKEKCKVIEAIWGGEYSWQYKTDIPHATFEIFDGEHKYCKGIVFDIKELHKSEIIDAIKLLRENGYVVRKLDQYMKEVAKECEDSGYEKECFGCPCSVCIVQY